MNILHLSKFWPLAFYVISMSINHHVWNQIAFLEVPGLFSINAVHFNFVFLNSSYIILQQLWKKLNHSASTFTNLVYTSEGQWWVGKTVLTTVCGWGTGFFTSIRWNSQGINACMHYNTAYKLSVETILRERWNEISVSTSEFLDTSLYSLEIFCHNNL